MLLNSSHGTLISYTDRSAQQTHLVYADEQSYIFVLVLLLLDFVLVFFSCDI